MNIVLLNKSLVYLNGKNSNNNKRVIYSFQSKEEKKKKTEEFSFFVQ
jgi:hypothetical protein